MRVDTTLRVSWKWLLDPGSGSAVPARGVLWCWGGGVKTITLFGTIHAAQQDQIIKQAQDQDSVDPLAKLSSVVVSGLTGIYWLCMTEGK